MAISGRGLSVVVVLILRTALFAADDVFDHVGRDVGNFFFAQGPTKGWHPATPVGDLFFGAGLFFGFRHRRQVRAAVATVAGGAVAGRAVFGEDFGAGFGVRGGDGFFAAFGFFAGARFFGGFFARFRTFFAAARLTRVRRPFGFVFLAFLAGHRAVQGEDPEVFPVRGRRQAVATGVDGDFLFALVFEGGHGGVGAGAGLEAPQLLPGFDVEGLQFAVVLADE